jgi:hypothetical protein
LNCISERVVGHSSASVYPGKCERSIEHAVARAFHTVLLLTASRQKAENAVSTAIDSFEPGIVSGETLLRNSLESAIGNSAGNPAADAPDASAPPEPHVPAELKSVLKLPENLRCCFVLRILAGMSRETCARLLGLNSCSVDTYTCAALQSLAGVNS